MIAINKKKWKNNKKWMKMNENEWMNKLGMSWKSREVHLDDLMTILKNEVSSHKSKNVDILSLVAQITQQLEGNN